jgi:hypothetical protein
MKIRFDLMVCALLLGSIGGANAQNWPARPIKIIVPTGPGAATDVMARLMADSITRGLRPAGGGGGTRRSSGLGAHQGAALSADGYLPVHQHLGACDQSSSPSSR